MNRIKLFRFIGWLMITVVVIFSMVPLPQASVAITGSDKLLHLSCYFSLAYWFLHIYPNQVIRIFWGLAIMGTLLELLQSLTSYRFMEWLDLIMNISGILVAMLFFHTFKIKVKYLLAG